MSDSEDGGFVDTDNEGEQEEADEEAEEEYQYEYDDDDAQEEDEEQQDEGAIEVENSYYEADGERARRASPRRDALPVTSALCGQTSKPTSRCARWSCSPRSLTWRRRRRRATPPPSRSGAQRSARALGD